MQRRLGEELGHDHKEQHQDADDLGRLQVEGVDLCTQLGGEGRVLNLLQAGAVDVPNAALRSDTVHRGTVSDAQHGAMATV